MFKTPQRIVLIACLALTPAGPALADIGDSFLEIPGTAGHYRGEDHKGWVRTESNAWAGSGPGLGMGGFAGAIVGGPRAPRPGQPARLLFMLSKSNPDHARLMQLCTSKAELPELVFSEAWGRGRPANMPLYVNYRLKQARIADCPVLADASAQGFALTFKDIEWLNAPTSAAAASPFAGGQIYAGNSRANANAAISLAAPQAGKQIKAWLITWLGIATDSTPQQCPVMNTKPTDADFYRYRSVEETAAIRKRVGEKGLAAGPETETRGPGNLNAVLLPGIVPDPGLLAPQSDLAEGIDLDGHDGRGRPPKGIRQHKNYTAADGRTGIDNQLYTVLGCVPGYRGKAGYRVQTDNARRADGNIVTVLEVSGIDDPLNDAEVEIALIHSRDKPIRDNTGKTFIPNYSFRPTDDARFANHNMRTKGRIVNGIIESEALPTYGVNSGQGPAYDLHLARLRIAPTEGGGIKAMLGGYLDWRDYATFMASGYSEGLFGYQYPAVWQAFKRNADGLYDPATGEYHGISAAYELDGVPAFLTPVEVAAAK